MKVFHGPADEDLVDASAVHVDHLEAIAVGLGSVALLRSLAQLLHQEAGYVSKSPSTSIPSMPIWR